MWLAVPTAPEPTPSAPEVLWDAPNPCPTQAAFESRLARRLSAVAKLEHEAEPTRAQILVSQDGDRYGAVLVVTADGGRTRRHLEGPDCEAIAEAAVLIVAMVHAERVGAVLPSPPVAPSRPQATQGAPPPVATSAASESPKPAKPPPSRASPSTSPPSPSTSAAATEGRARPGTRVTRKQPSPTAPVGLFGSANLGIGGLPGVGLGIEAGLALRWPRLRSELIGQFWPGREAPIGSPSAPARVDVRLGVAGIHFGPQWRLGPIELAPMAGLHGGLARGVGREVEVSRVARRAWVSVGVHLALLWPLHRRVALGLRGSFEGLVLRPRFALRDQGPARALSALTGALGATVEVRLGPPRKAKIR